MLGELTLCFDRTNLLEDLLHENMPFKADGRLQRFTDEADFDVRSANLPRSPHCFEYLSDKLVDGKGLKRHDQASVEIFHCEGLKRAVFENEAYWETINVARVLYGSV